MTAPAVTTYLTSWYSVRDFGAVGDGNSDDAAEIQQTMIAASIAGGGMVVVPRGRYRLDNSLTWSGLTNVCVWLNVGCVLTGTGTLPGATGTNNSIFDLRSGGTTSTVIEATGLPGTSGTSRFVGGSSTGGPPTTGTFQLGDYVVDSTGAIWICTTAGSPGTWTQAGGGFAERLMYMGG